MIENIERFLSLNILNSCLYITCFSIIVKTKDVKCLASPKLLSKFPISF